MEIQTGLYVYVVAFLFLRGRSEYCKLPYKDA